jgi:hypothetical protein
MTTLWEATVNSLIRRVGSEAEVDQEPPIPEDGDEVLSIVSDGKPGDDVPF